MKGLKCRDAGFDCEAVVRAESEDEVMVLVAEHAREVHGRCCVRHVSGSTTRRKT